MFLARPLFTLAALRASRVPAPTSQSTRTRSAVTSRIPYPSRTRWTRVAACATAVHTGLTPNGTPLAGKQDPHVLLLAPRRSALIGLVQRDEEGRHDSLHNEEPRLWARSGAQPADRSDRHARALSKLLLRHPRAGAGAHDEVHEPALIRPSRGRDGAHRTPKSHSYSAIIVAAMHT